MTTKNSRGAKGPQRGGRRGPARPVAAKPTTAAKRQRTAQDLADAAERAREAAAAAPGPLAAAPHKALGRTAEALSEAVAPARAAPPVIERGGTIMLTHPQTGAVLNPVEASDADLADLVEAIKEWESSAKEAKRAINRELHRRMDAGANWSLRAGGFKLQGESPERYEYDVDALRACLASLVAAEAITAEAADAAVKEEKSYKPVVIGINKLLKLGGEVKERIEACRTQKDKDARRVSISREP